MTKKKREFTDAELYNEEFEDLSLKIVEFLFRGTDAHISKTDLRKDGGYDIIVECSDRGFYQKVYFECKLRSGNLNLRDIAANIIIAYNEGAVALVTITNYDYTEQTNENLKQFFQKTVLNIKIIIGEDIKRIADKCSITIPANLIKIITSRKTYRKKTYDFLKINLDSAKPYERILYKNVEIEEHSKSFVTKYYEKEIYKIQNYLKNGDFICVEGFAGIGKTSIINYSLSKMTDHTIRIVADNFLSQSELLLSVFLDIWGIPVHTIVRNFTKDHIADIVAVVTEKTSSKATGEIIEKLLKKNSSEGFANEYYNYLICQYLIYILKIHHETISYVFFIENISNAPNEIQQLLIYICKLLKKNRIACIVEKDIVEYQWQYNNTSFFSKIDCFTVPINHWSDTDAKAFIDYELNEYPERFRQAVINRGGTRLLILSLIIDYCHEKSKNGSLATETDLQQFEPNEIPRSIDCLLRIYFEKAPELFCNFYFVNGKIPFEWSAQLLMPYQECVDHLLNMNFLGMDDTYVWIKGEIIMERIQQLVSNRSFLLHNCAKKILSFLQKQEKREYIESYIYIYDSLKKYDMIPPLLDFYMRKLFKERQYHSFMKWADYLLVNKEKLGLTLQMQLNLIIHILIIWRIKREISGENAVRRIYQMQDLILEYKGSDKVTYQMALDCFYAERYFQDCNFSKALQCSQRYYPKSLSRDIVITDYEWQEKICVIYALCIKEQEGNEKALDIFEKLRINFPKSFFIEMEYWDHLECINFFRNPHYALDCVNNVLDAFKKTPRYDYPLPFHEYVDRAMCALCAKEYDLAMQYSEEAIDILESNGILPSLGRAYNIKGCVFLCKNDIENARFCFKESKYLLDESKEYLYSWRSSLNLILLELTYKPKDFDLQYIIPMLVETYDKFREIYSEKMANLSKGSSFFELREYYALLMFQQAFRLSRIRKSILDDFDLTDKTEMFLKHFNQLQDKRITIADFSNCSYAVGKYIFMVG